MKQEVGLSGDIKEEVGLRLRQIGQVWKLNGQGVTVKSQRTSGLHV